MAEKLDADKLARTGKQRGAHDGGFRHRQAVLDRDRAEQQPEGRGGEGDERAPSAGPR